MESREGELVASPVPTLGSGGRSFSPMSTLLSSGQDSSLFVLSYEAGGGRLVFLCLLLLCASTPPWSENQVSLPDLGEILSVD